MRSENEINMMQEDSKEFHLADKNLSQIIEICSGLKDRWFIAVSPRQETFLFVKAYFLKNYLFDKGALFLKISKNITNKGE